jgi:hypothetical protein
MAVSIKQLLGIANNNYIPSGGTDSQVLAKKSNANFDVEWRDSGGSGTGVTAYTTLAELPLSNNEQGSLAFVSATNRLYIWNGTGWFNIALINTNPTISQGPNSSYLFAANGTPIVITLVASDPEGIPITWSYQITSGTLGNTATISQDDNVFTITPSTSDEDTGVFGVTFTASDGVNIATATSSFTLAFAAADAFYNQSIVLTTSSIDNGNNNVFVDSSTNNFTVTRNGNTTQGTFSPFSPAGWGGYFDGTSDALVFASNDAFKLETGNFTVEMWIYPTAFTGSNNGTLFNIGSYSNGLFIRVTSTVIQVYILNNERLSISRGTIITTDAWHHVALVRSGSTCTLYVNGSSIGTFTDSGSISPTDATIRIAVSAHNGTETHVGYISNLRLVKGTALYTANFTPSTLPLTAVSGTSLLTLQDNRFIDRSTNNFDVTVVGDPRITPFSPFLPPVSYNTSTHGGSAYFDGTGDWLTVGSNVNLALGASNWTVELWVYPTSVTVSQNIIIDWRSTNDGLPVLYMVNNQVLWRADSATKITSSTILTANTWYHIAVVRVSTTTTMYINGLSVGSYTDTTNYQNSDLKIGKAWDSNQWNGYMSNLRIVKGTALYTTNFTLPTAPVTAVANTSLLLNFTNSNIFDETGKVVAETVGNAKASTSVVKYGSSMAFDGNGDSLYIPNDPNINFGSGDFTLECWVYFNAVNTYMTIISKGWNSSAEYASYLIWMENTGSLRFNSSSNGGAWDIANERVIGTMTTGSWRHIAVTRSGTTFRAFVDGVINNAFTFTSSAALANLAVQNLYIGDRQTGSTSLNGYISDLRITKGVARYTANFTPPTAQLGYNNAE